MSTDADKEQQETADAIDRALSEACMWVNPVFRFNDRKFRIFRRRISTLEVVWALVSALVTVISLFMLRLLFGDSGPFFILFSPVAIAFWSILAMVFGRKIAFLSPLRRQTGEGTGIWIAMMFTRIITRVSVLFARPVMYNYCTSRAGDPHFNEKRVECIEWVGTSRSPRAPYSPVNQPNQPSQAVLMPRGRTIRNHTMIGDDEL